MASPLIFKRKSPRPERPAQPGPSGLRTAPAGSPHSAGPPGRRRKVAAPGQGAQGRAPGCQGPATPHVLPSLRAERKGQPLPRPPAPPTPQPRGAHSDTPGVPGTAGNARKRERQRRASRRREQHPSSGLARSCRPGPRRTRRHTLPPHGTWPFVCARELAHAPSARSRRSRRTRRSGRTRTRRAREPRAQPGPGAGPGRRRAARGAGAGARRSPARAQGREAARARSASSSRILRGSGGAAEPRVARRGGRCECRDHQGRGFIAEPRREAAPIPGTRVAAPPPGGASSAEVS